MNEGADHQGMSVASQSSGLTAASSTTTSKAELVGKKVLAGVLSGMFGSVVAHPLDVVKVRLQASLIAVLNDALRLIIYQKPICCYYTFWEHSFMNFARLNKFALITYAGGANPRARHRACLPLPDKKSFLLGWEGVFFG